MEHQDTSVFIQGLNKGGQLKKIKKTSKEENMSKIMKVQKT